jgi:uncharacterized protein (DUF2235 family)
MLEKLINAVKPRASVLSASESYARSIQDLVSAPTVKKPQALNEQLEEGKLLDRFFHFSVTMWQRSARWLPCMANAWCGNKYALLDWNATIETESPCEGTVKRWLATISSAFRFGLFCLPKA